MKAPTVRRLAGTRPKKLARRSRWWRRPDWTRFTSNVAQIVTLGIAIAALWISYQTTLLSVVAFQLETDIRYPSELKEQEAALTPALYKMQASSSALGFEVHAWVPGEKPVMIDSIDTSSSSPAGLIVGCLSEAWSPQPDGSVQVKNRPCSEPFAMQPSDILRVRAEVTEADAMAACYLNRDSDLTVMGTFIMALRPVAVTSNGPLDTDTSNGVSCAKVLEALSTGE